MQNARVMDAIVAIFNEQYEKAREVEFSGHWLTTSSYYDGAMEGEHAPQLDIGEIVRSISPAPNSRKLLIIGTPFGNVVVQQRYTKSDDVLALCSTYWFRRACDTFFTSPLTLENMHMLFGIEGFPNIGIMLQNALGFEYPDSNMDRIKESRRLYMLG